MQKLAIAPTLWTQESPSELSSSNEMGSASPHFTIEDVPQDLKEKLLDFSHDYAQWVRLAALRILVSPFGWKFVTSPNLAPGADIAGIIGLNLDEYIGSMGAAAARAAFQAIAHQIESSLSSPRPFIFPKKLETNLTQLSKLVGLSDTEEAVLGLAILFHTEPAVILLEDWLGLDVHVNALPNIFATTLGLPVIEVKKAFSTSSRLCSSGLLTVENHSGNTCISLHIDLITKSFPIRMTNGEPLFQVFGSMFRSAPRSTLKEEDYAHIEHDLNLAIACLENWSPETTTPLNILLFGPAGTGKTTLARLLAEKAGFHANEILEMNEDGSPMAPVRRARACHFSQALFQHARELLILDEAEEVILAQERDSGEKITKSWINSFLEAKAPPGIFICNDISQFDPASLRRFDLCIHVPIPPRQARMRLIEEACQGQLAEATLNAIADQKGLAPAILSKAARIALDTQHGQSSQTEIQQTTLLVLNQHLVATGNKPITVSEDMGFRFDPRLTQTNVDLEALLEGLKRAQKNNGQARGVLLLSGCPGTGKTSMGKWLAEELGQPIALIKASDLKSPYSGQTEINIRHAMENAQRDGAVLQIDELDSFLVPREKATQAYQISETNEFLTALDDYQGIFIGTTNATERLDVACHRRLDLHIQFDFPDRETVREIYRRVSASLSLDPVSEQDLMKLDAINQLTPGDFAQAKRRHRLVPIQTHADLLAQLQQCAGWKPGHSRRIGF